MLAIQNDTPRYVLPSITGQNNCLIQTFDVSIKLLLNLPRHANKLFSDVSIAEDVVRRDASLTQVRQFSPDDSLDGQVHVHGIVEI